MAPTPDLQKILTAGLAPLQPSRLEPLLAVLKKTISRRIADLENNGRSLVVRDPDWCRANSAEAGEMHARVIIETYGNTYALPNKSPEANQTAIESGLLDIYLMEVDGELTGTACLVDLGGGVAELGRASARPHSSNSVIQDLRIARWLTEQSIAERYHTLSSTLRTAPDRLINDLGGDFTMRGGRAVIHHWATLPTIQVNGIAPLYLKHGALEQFALTSITRLELDPAPVYLSTAEARNFVTAWHANYDLDKPNIISMRREQAPSAELTFSSHLPPTGSGITHLVHADLNGHLPESLDTDVVPGEPLASAVEAARLAGSPFLQVRIPCAGNSIGIQTELAGRGFKLYGYEPGRVGRSACLLFGQVAEGRTVIPTFWEKENIDHPLWANRRLRTFSRRVEAGWR